MSKRKRNKKVVIDKKTAHFMKVCSHGVPHGFLCRTCDKIISIPEDAVIKPEGYAKEVKPEDK